MGWSGIGQAIFDPLNVTGAFGGGGSSPSQPVDPNSLGYMAGMAGLNPEKPQEQPGLYLPDAEQDYGLKPEVPRTSPFQAQWQYAPGKGPQWVEPVDNGVSLQPKRKGDLIWNESVDNGWSSRVNNGPAKGNRF
jgi:hypothetical protein